LFVSFSILFTLMSIWKAVMPSASPATLKSMSPSASSEPRMSVRTTERGGEDDEPSTPGSKISPIATPAMGRLSGTPASSMARHPPQTEAMEEEPLDSVMVDSTRMVYGKSASGGTDGASARSASAPCPISRRPGPPIRPVSPTDEGGKKYCR